MKFKIRAQRDSQIDAEDLVHEFSDWIEGYRTEISALKSFYNPIYLRPPLLKSDIAELINFLITTKPHLAPMKVWQAFEILGGVSCQPPNEHAAIISLVRHARGLDEKLVNFDSPVEYLYNKWIKNYKIDNPLFPFDEEQMRWLHLLKLQLIANFRVEVEELDQEPFLSLGGQARMFELFGGRSKGHDVVLDFNEMTADNVYL